MPVEPKLYKGKIRQIDLAGKNKGKPALNKNDNPVDGGGWEDTPANLAKATRQANDYINPSERT